MNCVKLYNSLFNYNVADLEGQKIHELLLNKNIETTFSNHNYLAATDFSCLIYPKGYFHDVDYEDKLVIGDSYFYNCDNCNGEEIIGEFQCPYFSQNPHATVCNMTNDYITSGVQKDDYEEDHWTHCETCPHHEEWSDRCSAAEGDEISTELMEMLFYCMCEYKYSGILFTPVHFTIADYEGSEVNPEYYYCYNTESKVSVAHMADNITPSLFIKTIHAFNRIFSAQRMLSQGRIAALNTYGLNILPTDYKIQVCAWLHDNPEIREKFYTDF
jgi:hypothetical protein